ncbi:MULTISPECIES: ABC transporter substrate-binding protein [unclassified Salinibacterium]|uniref:ABC transporter substrate-binding protein n=1 Tax=unclassified Salinibacterium TaxID=2632331 RepID=UPI001423D280|nr:MULTISPECIES: ABC transporter substrate-binding protein [unclassified Salinibacterium]
MKRFMSRAMLPGVALAALLATTGCATTTEPAAPQVEVEEGGLAEMTTVKVGLSGKIAYYLPYLMEEHWGEFAKQNIKLEIEYAPAPDALVLMSTGRIDAMVTGPSANMLNAVAMGTELRMVAPGGVEDDESVNGWYVGTKALDGAEFDVSMLKGKTLASSSGVAGPPLLTLSETLAEAGLTLADVEIASMKQTDAVIALENGAIFGATASHPNTATIAEAKSGIMFARSAPKGWPSTNVFFGPNLLSDKPEVGEAFVRALANIYKNHMQGDFMHTPENIELIAAALETDVDVVRDIPSAVYPTELSFPDDYFEAYENVYRQIPEVLSYDADTSVADRLIDMRFIEALKK